MLTELSRPFSYLSIRHPAEGVRWVNWWLPLLASIALVALCGSMERRVDLFGASGVINKVLGFIQSLPGFYLAALAAVATFNNPDMDRLMPGTPPTARILYNGKLITVELTRRRMLCIMFAYLTVLSFVLTMSSIAAMTFAEDIKAAIQENSPLLIRWIKAAFTSIYFGALFQMLTITMWGLFYLGERMHTPDR
ncbi:hypothetical protein [Paucibacter sp. KCTC 42545]|uniref:hypothetical protein n=1 Tax=Paucibacter sp. KCTC 42545 TaxID=1768242 RepID=UPI0012E35B01|nr:hypothetical protein [Paucibacter sp. KCTC 42545]